MKNLMIVLTLFAGSLSHALPSSLEDRIHSNDYRCEEPEFVLKGYWGDWLGQSFAMKAREYARAESCEKAILGLYGQGSEVLFELFDQIKSVKNPQMLAPLIGHTTTFDSARKDMVISRLKQLGVNFEDRDNQWAILMARFADARRDVFTRDVESKLLPHARNLLQKASFSRDAYKNEYFFTPRRTLGESIFKLDLQLRPYRQGIVSAAVMKEIADKFIASVNLPEWISESIRGNNDAQPTSPLPYLVRNEKQNLFTDRYFFWADSPYLTLTALAAKNVDAIKRFTGLAQPGQMQSAMFAGKFPAGTELCPTVLGAAVAEKAATELRRAILDLYNKLDCRSIEYYQGGVAFTDEDQLSINNKQVKNLASEHDNDSSVLLTDLLRRGVKFDVDLLNLRNSYLVQTCAAPSVIEPFVTLKNVMPLLTEAFDASCEPLTGFLMSAVKDRRASAEVAEYLTNLSPKKLAQFGVKRVEFLMGVAGAKLAANKSAELEEFITPPEPNPTKFAWRGSEFELIADKLSRPQVQFLKRLRSATSEKQIIVAIRDGLLAKQLRARHLSEDDLAEVQNSIQVFKASGLKSGLREAKALLDKTLSVAGGASIYNEKFTSVFDIFRSRRAQCVSGTEFMLLHLSVLETLMADGQIALTIHRPRHVLPGTFDQRKKQIELIESTAAGEARGLLRLRTKQLPQDTQVILADDYLVFQILSDVLSKPAEARAFALNRAANLLKIKQGEITPSKSQTADSGDLLNQTIFGFGDADIPVGDVPRRNIEKLPSGFSPAQMAQPDNATNGAGFATAESARSSRWNQQLDPVSSLIDVAQSELSFLRRYGPLFWASTPESVEILREAFRAVEPKNFPWLMERIVSTPRAMFILNIQNGKSTFEMGVESPEQKSGVSDSTRRDYLNLRKLHSATPIVIAKSKEPLAEKSVVLEWAIKDAILILKINRRGEPGRAFELSVIRDASSPTSPRYGYEKDEDPT